MTRFPRSTGLTIYRGFLVLLVSLALSLLHGVPAARAENLGPGGGSRILVGDQVVGPYRLYITVSPEPAYTGTLTYLVRISDPASNQKVLDADVTVELLDSEDGTHFSGRATHKDAGTAIDYAAHIPVEKAGTYNGVIHISGPAGDTEVTFTQAVLTPRRWTGVIIVGLPFLAVLAVLGGLWFARSGQRTAPS